MTLGRRIGILGGTFDPTHFGHLGAALAARQALALDRVVLVPANVPPHRRSAPDASGPHRLAMAALAVGRIDGLEVSDLELRREGPSYTALTLRALQADGVDRQELYFITGADAFADIATWHEYPHILDLAHFVVIARPGHDFRGLRARLPDLAYRMRTIAPMRGVDAAVRSGEPEPAHGPPHGWLAIWLVETTTPDVSSSGIRDRIRAGRLLSGLVPPLVERYITRHGLYRPRPADGGGGREATSA